MKMGKYDNLISFVGKPDDVHPDFSWDGIGRIVWMDPGAMPGTTYFEMMWFYAPREPGPPTHTHDFDEIIGFVGGDPENPKELGATVHFRLGDESYTFTKSVIIFIPAGMEHSPIHVEKVEKPFIHFSGGPAKSAYDKADAE